MAIAPRIELPGKGAFKGVLQILGRGEIDDSRGILVSRFFGKRPMLMERAQQSIHFPLQRVHPTASSTPAELSCSRAAHPADRRLLSSACPLALPSSGRVRGQGKKPSLDLRQSFSLIPEVVSLYKLRHQKLSILERRNPTQPTNFIG